MTKLNLEWNTWKSGCFVTLTYDQENLPDRDYFRGGSLIKKDLQNFIKRYRKYSQEYYGKRMIRYFGVGEYGTESQRAHYHLLLFNVDLVEAERVIKKAWKFGHSRIDPLHINRIKYTIGYTIKKETSLKDFPDGREPEFSIMSKHPQLGAYALPAIAERLKKHNIYPSRSLEAEHQWRLREEGKQLQVWAGNFRQGGMYCKLDRPMMTKLAAMVDPGLKDRLDIIKSNTLLLPKEFRAYKARAADQSYIDKIQFELGEDHELLQKKTQKEARKIKKKIQQI